MKKISKILTTFALCGLFTFTNTSGIEDNIVKNLPIRNSVTTVISSQWYGFDTNSSYPIITNTISCNLGLFDYSLSDSVPYVSFRFDEDYVVFKSRTGSISAIEKCDLSDYAICFGDNVLGLSSISSCLYSLDNSTFTSLYKHLNLDLKRNNFSGFSYFTTYEDDAIVDNYFVKTSHYSSSTYDKIIYKGLFLSNGNLYKQIQVTYALISSPADWHYFDNSGAIKRVSEMMPSSGYRAYRITYIRYLNINDTWVNAFTGNKVAVVPNYGFVYYSGSSPFDNYNYIELFNYSTENTGLYMFNNFFEAISYSSPVSINGGGSLPNALVNAFDILILVFTSLGGFLSFSIFPGITIGLLLLIPLVVTIIVLIFKVVK